MHASRHTKVRRTVIQQWDLYDLCKRGALTWLWRWRGRLEIAWHKLPGAGAQRCGVAQRGGGLRAPAPAGHLPAWAGQHMGSLVRETLRAGQRLGLPGRDGLPGTHVPVLQHASWHHVLRRPIEIVVHGSPRVRVGLEPVLGRVHAHVGVHRQVGGGRCARLLWLLLQVLLWYWPAAVGAMGHARTAHAVWGPNARWLHACRCTPDISAPSFQPCHLKHLSVDQIIGSCASTGLFCHVIYHCTGLTVA